MEGKEEGGKKRRKGSELELAENKNRRKKNQTVLHVANSGRIFSTIVKTLGESSKGVSDVENIRPDWRGRSELFERGSSGRN